MRPRKICILSLAMGVAFSSARARLSDFLPRPFENGLYVEAFASREREDNRGSAEPFGWTDTFLKEQLTVHSKGYFYHPRFLQYQISLTGALKQEKYSTTESTSGSWVKGTGFEYDTRLVFLPEHPYNLDLFALRQEPLYMEQSTTQHDAVETSNGAQFRYRRKPLFFNAGYLDNTTRSSAQTANVERLTADGQYFKDYAGGNQLSLNAAYHDSWFTGSGGLEGSSRDYGGGGYLILDRARLNTSLSKSTSDQETPLSGRFDNDQFAFYELVTLELPANFTTEAGYQIHDNRSTAFAPGGASGLERTELSKEFQFAVDHRLYQSLDSRYSFLHNDRTFSAGESTLTSHALSFDYHKLISRGRVMTGLNGGRNDSDNRGRSDIIREAHPGTAVPGSFRLNQQNVQPASVVVSLPSSLPPFETLYLVENVHYTLTAIANALEINVITLPSQFVLPGTFDLSVSYSLASGDFELRTTTYGFNASVALLDNLLTPYVGYAEVRSDVVAGTFPGVSLDSTTRTAGLTFLSGPWRAMAEYQYLQWAVSPYESWRGEVQYVASVTPATRVYATGAFVHRYHPDGVSSQQPEAYTDRTVTVTGNVQHEIFSRGLMLTGGASYSQLAGRVEGDAYSLDASLTWKIGKLDLSAGADASGSTTRSYGGTPYGLDRRFYYVRLRRYFDR